MSSRPVGNQKRFTIHRFTLFFLMGLVVLAINVSPIEAQKITQWEPDKRVPGYSDDTFFTPFLVADQNRTVHAFAIQSAGDDNRNIAIVYRQWSQEKGWTLPVDIFFFTSGDAQIIGAFLDTKGLMHLAFLGGEIRDAKIYYTNALASMAGDASAWSLPAVVGTGASDPSYGSITGDNKGNLVIVYNGNTDGIGVYSVASTDAGYSWSKTAPVFLTQNTQLAPYYLKAYTGESGTVHVVWSIFETKASGKEFVSLYYDRLDIANGQWSEPVLLEKKPDIGGYFGPSVSSVVDNGKYVVVMYNSGNPYTGQPVPFGRPMQRVQISTDDGRSWGGATNPFPLLTGQSGEFSMVVDGNQIVHAIFIMRIDISVNGKYSEIAGVWHSELRNNNWSNPERFVTSINPVNLRAVVSQGNVILAVWKEDPANGLDGIWYSYNLLDSPELPVVALPTPPVKPTLTPSSIIASLISTSTPENKYPLVDQSNITYTPAQPLLCGIVPVILLVFGVIIAVWLHDRRKN